MTMTMTTMYCTMCRSEFRRSVVKAGNYYYCVEGHTQIFPNTDGVAVEYSGITAGDELLGECAGGGGGEGAFTGDSGAFWIRFEGEMAG